MAPATRTHAARNRGAAKSGGSGRKSKGSGKAVRPRVQCPECGEDCAAGAGLASHQRAKHPPAPPAVEPVVEAPVEVVEPALPPSDRVVPAPPDGLGDRSRDLWRQIVNVYDLRPDELRILDDACREAQLIDRLERQLEDAPLMVKGSMGQWVASPLVSEVRQHRSTLAGLLKRLDLPDDDVSADSPAERSTKARAAANARWRRGA